MPEMDDTQFNAMTAYFRSLLSDKRITELMVDNAVDADSFAQGLDDKTRLRIKRTLKQSLFITQDSGAIITSECQPWLAARRPDLDPYYWNRLRDYLIGTGELPAEVVSRLDSTTDEILDCCGDPLLPGKWSSRGMVMGHVQSGKTTNYAALICKAADAGYKVIILLAGITKSLRSQTQQRMDEYFIGRKSVFNAAVQAPLPIQNYSGGKRRDPDFGTSRDSDFSRQNAVAGAPFSALREPKIFVLKKNKSVLENLHVWIRDQAHGQKIDEPLLMIDDEADNASINTHKDPDRSTAINLAIRDILEQFNRSTFVGYTATPFANIFIDPESSEEMRTQDLFPRNFIKALDPPSNYCGAERYFTDEGDLAARCVVPVEDHVDILPLKHKKIHPVERIPPSLERAIRVFVVARAIRILRGDGKKHCTMMVNASRFNDVQEKLEGAIYAYVQQLKQKITIWAKSERPFSDPDIVLLRDAFEEEYSSVLVDEKPIQFEEILKVLKTSVTTIIVTTVNMRRKAGNLNYDANKGEGLHVIAIGGLALSRGLTLSGLVTTYLLRNVGASDTLMQMARWFGYRPNYEDLCRIFLPNSAIDHYQETHLAIEELREEINRMSLAGGTPIDFGLKVRQSETGIRITAANKMRTAVKMQLAAGYSARFVQGHAIFNSSKVNKANFEVAARFLADLGPSVSARNAPFYWAGVDGRDVVRLLEALEFPREVQPLWKLEGRRSLLSDYILDRLDDELESWDVCIASRSQLASDSTSIDDFLPGKAIYPVERGSADIADGGQIYRFAGKKNAVADQDTPTIGLSGTQIEDARKLPLSPPENRYCKIRQKPLLVLFLVRVKAGLEGCKLNDCAFSLAVCLPETEKLVREQTYQINKVLRDQMRNESEENADDDDEISNEE